MILTGPLPLSHHKAFSGKTEVFLHNKTGNYAAALQDIQKASELGIQVSPAYITELRNRVNSGT